MARRARYKKREFIPDRVYNSVSVTRFIKLIMKSGKEAVAEKIFYSALDEAAEQLKVEPMELYETAMSNVIPTVEVRSKRIGGATYQVPVEVSAVRGQSIGKKAIIRCARNNRKNVIYYVSLKRELVNAYNNTGNAVKLKEDKHKMAEANKAYSHIRFY